MSRVNSVNHNSLRTLRVRKVLDRPNHTTYPSLILFARNNNNYFVSWINVRSSSILLHTLFTWGDTSHHWRSTRTTCCCLFWFGFIMLCCGHKVKFVLFSNKNGLCLRQYVSSFLFAIHYFALLPLPSVWSNVHPQIVVAVRGFFRWKAATERTSYWSYNF